MKWRLNYLPEVVKDFASLAGNQKMFVRKAVKKTLANPLPRNKGGYGISLGNKGGVDLKNFLEIKLRGAGIRVIYKLVETETEMLVVIIGMREDEIVYNDAKQRIDKYKLGE